MDHLIDRRNNSMQFYTLANRFGNKLISSLKTLTALRSPSVNRNHANQIEKADQQNAFDQIRSIFVSVSSTIAILPIIDRLKIRHEKLPIVSFGEFLVGQCLLWRCANYRVTPEMAARWKFRRNDQRELSEWGSSGASTLRGSHSISITITTQYSDPPLHPILINPIPSHTFL